MTLLQLVVLANNGYSTSNPDVSLLEFVDREGKPMNPPPPGDTLALFIVRELSDTYDANAKDDAQLSEASRVIERARYDLGCVVAALS